MTAQHVPSITFANSWSIRKTLGKSTSGHVNVGTRHDAGDWLVPGAAPTTSRSALHVSSTSALHNFTLRRRAGNEAPPHLGKALGLHS